ncbi:LuxR family transcriptional regulator [Bradyrhizobium sp.]|uniref:helix-turn-helix transcriptional regulator n=1 Tax=Bradyrhizobium sp. TaxID=376 RepID=UPI0025BBC08C|nr:LuxR family transcriptional regulator [Bradyrhizobium sp.]
MPRIKLPNLIEEIYDAALEPALWNDIVRSINEFVGGRACGLISKDTMSRSGLTYYYCGVDPYYIQLYSETHSRYDHLTVLPPLGQVVSIPDLLHYDEYRHGPFYQEWLQPQGCVDIANVVLEKSSSNSAVLLAILTGGRMADDEMRRRISLIVPHTQRALHINRTIDSRQSEAAAFADTLNGLGAGVFLLDAGCRIVHANAAGHDILRADDFLRSVNGQLVARNVRVNQALRETVAQNGDVSIDVGEMALPLAAHDGQRYAAHLLPLTSAARTGIGKAYKAVVALFVRKLALDSPCGELLARTFKLTPAELRVLMAVSEAGGVPAVAERVGVSEATAKTHLQHLFSKTGTNRQIDLVKLVAAHASPLRNQ